MGIGTGGWRTAGRARTGAAAFAIAMPAAHALAIPCLAAIAAASWLVSWHALWTPQPSPFGLALASFGATSLLIGAASPGPALAVVSGLFGVANAGYAFASSGRAARR